MTEQDVIDFVYALCVNSTPSAAPSTHGIERLLGADHYVRQLVEMHDAQLLACQR